MWRSVNLGQWVPYFLISHAFKKGRAWIYETSLLWHETDVLNFCNEVGRDSRRRILQVSMLLPSGGAACWRMEELKEIWCDADDKWALATIFVAVDGKQLGHSRDNQGIARFAVRKRLY